MSEEQKDKYKQAAKAYESNAFGTTCALDIKVAYTIGTEHAHPIGFNLGKEEGKVEGWNACIKMIEEERNVLQNTGSLMWHKPEDQNKALHVAECLSISLKYITELQKSKVS